VTLPELERQVRRDLEDLTLPRANWPCARPGPDGRPMHDVVVVGAGHCGLLAGAALLFKGIRNIEILDQAAQGREGIWSNSARMPTLRSPKTLPGMTLGLPNLTFRRWYEAAFGSLAWEALGRFPTDAWQSYMTWFRQVLRLPVTNEVVVQAVLPADGCLTLLTSRGPMHARRVVWATGGTNSLDTAVLPDGIARELWPDLAAHSCEDIDFVRLAGRRVAVLGGGASAFDNACTAIEHGAARVDLHVRDGHLCQVNRYLPYLTTCGISDGWTGLPDADRWAMAVLVYRDSRNPPTLDSVQRLMAHANVHLHLGSPVLAASLDGDGIALCIGSAPERNERADFLIVATGFRSELARLPELRGLLPHAALWRDRYTPPPELAMPELGNQAYLDVGLALTERVPGSCPALRRLHIFTRAGEVSAGSMVSNIANANVGAERIAVGITHALAAEDVVHLRATITGFERPEFEGTPFYAPERVPFAANAASVVSASAISTSAAASVNGPAHSTS